MNNQKGITLIELLVTIVILGIIVIPILTLMTNAFTNTVSQGRETQTLYFAQQVIEEVRVNSYPSALKDEIIYGTCSPNSGCTEINIAQLEPPLLGDTEVLYEISFSELSDVTDDEERNQILAASFFEVEVTVKSNAPNSQDVSLVTVVKKQP
ncbi:type IV pilus modification PilV family protein [Alkalihalobacterium alkalinitrilicum]|uniref:type IV pilus modification PilV family protein n=1 Tax=Alkalihalobacterium alkalinitrilicum TaxID=427920 RepID=UPI000995167D|nr:type II secretion system protein [Alkalihalobacterium alkalinitrilicum]